MDTSPKLRQRCIPQQPSHPTGKADTTSACRMLAPPDAGWPLPGKPEEGCSTAGAAPAAGLKYSPKWQSATPQNTELRKQETSVSSEKHEAIDHEGGEKAEHPHPGPGQAPQLLPAKPCSSMPHLCMESLLQAVQLHTCAHTADTPHHSARTLSIVKQAQRWFPPHTVLQLGSQNNSQM